MNSYQEYIDQYIGENQIKLVGISERKSLLGKDIIVFFLDNQMNVEYSEDLAIAIITKEKSSASDLQNNFNNYITKKILEILLDSEIKLSDIQPLLNKVDNSIAQNMTKANDILWGKDFYQRTLKDVQDIFNGQPKGEETTSETSNDNNVVETGGSELAGDSANQA